MRAKKIFDYIYQLIFKWQATYHAFSQLLSGGNWEKWQNKVFENLSGKKILEIGPGPGKLLLRMAKKGYDVYAVELHHGMALEAEQRLARAGYQVEIHHESIEKTTFSDNMFDSVVSTFVFSEIESLDTTISEIKRVLKPGGKAIIISGSIPIDRNIIARTFYTFLNLGTLRPFTRDNAEYFRKYGFKTTRYDFGPFSILNKVVAIKV